MMTCSGATAVSRWKILAAAATLAIAGTLAALAPAAAQASVAAPFTWSTPAWLAGASQIDALTCPSISLCVAVDDDGHVLTSTNPAGGASAWTVTDIDGSTQINSLSCPSTSLCVAVDMAGNVLTSTDPAGGAPAWSAVKPAGQTQLNSVSCPSTTLCIIGGLGWVLTSTDPAGGVSAWHGSGTASPADWFDANSLSCPTTTMCVATDMSGDNTDILTSTDPAGGGSTWSSVALPHVTWVVSMSCPTASLCVTHASDSGFADNQVILSSTDPADGGHTWEVAPVTRNGWSGGMSCISASYCLAFTGDGIYYSGDPAGGASAWNYTDASSSATVLTCPSRWLCVAAVLSSSGSAGIEVGTAPRPTTTALRLSASSVRFGHEHSERLAVTVRSGAVGSPAGTVIVTSGTLTICTMRLRDGKATCALTAQELRTGRYRLHALYQGSSRFLESTSAAARLTIRR